MIRRHTGSVILTCIGVVSVGVLAGGRVAAAGPLDPPPPERLAEARQIVQEMIDNPRGPYSRIRWFCNDGTVQPPVAYACQEHGGGRQHAQYSEARERLAEIGWPVGTVFAATTLDTLTGDDPRRTRLRQLPLERFLVDTDNGWVLRRARNYRGRVQIEDEQAAGAALLTGLLADARWSLDNFLLVRELARTIPHGDDSDLARDARRQAIELAERDPGAERWRVEIHNNPSAATASRLREWAASGRDTNVAALARELADTLDRLYGEAGRRTRIDRALARVGSGPVGKAWRQDVAQALERAPLPRLSALCASMATARESLFEALPAARRLALVDALRELEADVQLSYLDLVGSRALARGEYLELGDALLRCAYASGLLSATEVDAIAPRTLSERSEADLETYRDAVMRLRRAPGWAMGSVRYTFAEALAAYVALEPRSARFTDDLLRGSPMWLLADTLKALSRDVAQLSGVSAELLGKPAVGVVALNPGIASGTLRIFETLESLEDATLSAGDIVVIPETIAELTPVAGILTLGEGNALSHVQLLARNFGIPNVAIDYDAIATLAPVAGKRVRLIVGSDGSVVLEADEATAAAAAGPEPAAITVPVPELDFRSLLTLDDIDRSLSGRIVGPKAANLGELNRLFPGRVAPAIAVPFGIYAEHLADAGLGSRIAAAFAARRSGELSDAAFADEMASLRSAIASVSLSPELTASLSELMRAQFGAPGSYGVFVRSDTNVEDLPQFTGAGLNETVPNLVDPAAQRDAVPRVWSSVLSPRALAWRSRVLANPERIYASVLLMKAVPATKSGVLVTANLADRGRPGLTASVAWGVGGAVAGEAAETIVITPDGTEVLSEAKAPYQRHLSSAGGVTWIPAPAGPVITTDEAAQLRALAAEVDDKYAPVFDDAGRPRPWDIEFGFVDGELTLFQIRPLVERGSTAADAAIRARRQEPAVDGASAGQSVDLEQPPRE